MPIMDVSWPRTHRFHLRRSGAIPRSTIPSNLLSGCRGTRQSATANGLAHAPRADSACRLRPSGSAARGGQSSALFPWGDASPQSLPGYGERCAGHWKTGPEPVGRADSNTYGLYNICDNVQECCSDWYEPAYYAVSPERNPRGPETGERRASRGGSWRHHIKMSRCAARSSIPPEFHYADYGFRVACDNPE